MRRYMSEERETRNISQGPRETLRVDGIQETTYLSAILNTIRTAPGVWIHIISRLSDPTVLACHVR